MAALPDDISLLRGGAELLDRIEPLWQQLRLHHAALSSLWRDGLLSANFPQRKSGLIEKSSRGLRATLAICDHADVAYCISTIAGDGQGEIDSLFVLEQHRHRGIARALMTDAMQWLRAQHADPIVVEVISGNDEAARLYERFGFRVRTLRLRLVDATDATVAPATRFP